MKCVEQTKDSAFLWSFSFLILHLGLGVIRDFFTRFLTCALSVCYLRDELSTQHPRKSPPCSSAITHHLKSLKCSVQRTSSDSVQLTIFIFIRNILCQQVFDLSLAALFSLRSTWRLLQSPISLC